METTDTNAKARQVKEHIGGNLPGASIEYKYLDRNPQPTGSDIAQWQPRQESQLYLYRITHSGATTEVEVTLDAVRYGDANRISECILDFQKRAERRRMRLEWRADRLVPLPLG